MILSVGRSQILIILTAMFATSDQLTTSSDGVNHLEKDYTLENKRIETLEESKINKAINHYKIDYELAKYIYDVTIGLELDYYIFLELIYRESSFIENIKSSTGAIGYCQIFPIVERDVFNRYKVKLSRHNPKENILLGAYFLKALLTDYNLELKEALVFYNAGSRENLQVAGLKYANKILNNKLEG